MRYGFFTMPLHPPGADPARTLAEDLDQLVVLDGLGYSEAWIGEHFTSVWESIPSPDLLIAQALAATKRIMLGTGVSCLPNHNPLMLAQRIAQLDQMARGRFAWGVGSGGFVGDFELFDIDTANLEQRKLTRDILDTILRLWTDPAPGVYEHPRWRFRIPETRDDIGVRLHMRPYQQPHPPIAVAGIGPRSDMLTLAGERGWLPLSINIVPVPVLRAHWETYAASAEQAGRPADRAVWRIAREVYVGDTPESARREAIEGTLGRDWAEYLVPMLSATNMLIAPKIDPAMPDSAVTLDYLCDNIWIVGDVAEVTEKLVALHGAVGGFGTLLTMGHEWTAGENWPRSMRLLAEEVIPRVRERIGAPAATA